MRTPTIAVCSLLILSVACGTQTVLAQDAAAANASSPVNALRKVTEDKPDPGVLKQVDSLFAEVVDAMNAVLFYRIGRDERSYIVYQRESVYVRDRGSDGPFVNVHPDDEGVPQQLDDAQIEIRAAKNELVEGHVIDGEKRYYRLGTLDEQPVEYVTLKRGGLNGDVPYGSKFVLEDDGKQYRVLTKKRNLPGELTVAAKTVAGWHESGFLKTSAEPADGDPVYLFREAVGGVPFVVAWLAAGGVFFTLFMRGFNFWGFRHAVDIVRGKYDNPDETGEVTHFQALASALSATIGLGNIAGVTIAMTLGGPGAFFWMLLCGLFGMCTKFVECTLGQKYRHVKPDGTILGGPFRYLKVGLQEMRLGLLGAILSFLFAVMCLLASFGGGNMLQANQAGSAMLQMFQQDKLDQYSQLSDQIKAAAEADDVAAISDLQQQRAEIQRQTESFEKLFKPVYGVVLAILVGAVIIGGIKRIGAAAAKIVPSMCIMYVLACLYIIFKHLPQVPTLVGQIFSEAFSGQAMGGGIIGVLVVGVQRAAFSNEAGAGSAAIAHSAAKTEQPVREGCVALLGPFIDTIVVCSMTALVILITGAWDNADWVVEQGLEGSALTSRAFKEEISWFPILLSVAVTLFAYSTIISWSYYGEKSWETLFGARTTFVYKILAVIAVFVGSIVNLGSVLDFSDTMILGMAFPNILGVVLLSPKVRRDLQEYWQKYKAGEFPTYK